MGTENNKEDRNSPEYLSQLLKDKKQLQAFPNVFVHMERLLEDEIARIRSSLFHHKGNSRESLPLPASDGQAVTLSQKLYVPVKEHPDFNFVGRILGPRGMTAKELEQYTGCKIMVRGKGSMRDKVKEELNRGKPNWEHLNEELHVLITVEDTRNRAEIKLQKAVEEVKRLLVPAASRKDSQLDSKHPEGEDELKKMQLMELAILNGTYRDFKTGSSIHQAPRMCAPPLTIPQLRAANPSGGQIILTPRLPSVATSTGILNGAPPPLVSPPDPNLMYNPYEYPYALAAHTAILEYPTIDQTQTGPIPKIRRTLSGVREHPYNRVALP
ncbi:KH domain-containing RNA-binding protein qki.L isoform X6 [Octopus bimaculoides]|uniref:KH domain-containing RNA-binding protein qki.L isoform X6 n=1 Tax=Octopus bimaculoides TaxID=37653 RepID=UPI00071C725E|nr:KH domain-containing RNA-binding protein qki.L isoform X6 [Octopus bimaculoides]|eukprot:XP_014791401.1 PREDICTED: protein quaking-B-like isoform X8 [Octopus bimaculoides]